MWYLDSGATEHMINTDQFFVKNWQLEKEVRISVAKNGQVITAQTAGNIKGKILVDGKLETCTVTNVLYVPELKHNLVSVRRLEMLGLKIIFENNKATISKGDKIIGGKQGGNKNYMNWKC